MYISRSFQLISKQLIFFLCLLSSLFLVSCGDEGGDDTTVNIQQPEREEGAASPGRTVIINNNVEPDIRIKNKNLQVDNSENALKIIFEVDNADDVIHQHGIYPANSCGAIAGGTDSAANRGGIEEELGSSVVTLNDGQGSKYFFNQMISLALLPPEEKFIFVVYGVQEDPSLAVACFPYEVKIAQAPTAPTGPTDGSDDSAALNSCGIPNVQIQNIRSLFTNLSDSASFRGTAIVNPERRSGQAEASVTQIEAESWRFSGIIKNDVGEPILNHNATLEIRPDGCVYSNGLKSRIISSSSNRLSINTEYPTGILEESYIKGSLSSFDYNLKLISNEEITVERRFDLQNF